MTNDFVFVTGLDGEVYEVCPTDSLLRFLRRLAEGECAESQCVAAPPRTCVFSSDEVELSYSGHQG